MIPLMKHNIPYIKKSLVTILTNPPSPYHLVHEYYHPLANKLQNLPQYGVNMHSFGDNYLTFHTHNRFQHSLDVALLLERIAHNLQLPGNITNFLIIA